MEKFLIKQILLEQKEEIGRIFKDKIISRYTIAEKTVSEFTNYLIMSMLQ